MTKTKCNKCGKEGNERVINRWVWVRFSEGIVADYYNKLDHKLDLCMDCFDELLGKMKVKKEEFPPIKGHALKPPFRVQDLIDNALQNQMRDIIDRIEKVSFADSGVREKVLKILQSSLNKL